MVHVSIINQKPIKSRCISRPRSWSHVNNTVVLALLTFQHIQCLHLMYAEVAWVIVPLGTHVQPQIILDPDYLPDHLSVSYDYDLGKSLAGDDSKGKNGITDEIDV